MSASERMSATELRAALGLASIFGLRMIGMFAILPVFALYAATLRGGADLTLVGFALGAYGLSQAVFQIPFGRWSDRVGRKPMLYCGLLVFAAGSFIAALAHTIHGVILGRLLQGAGAVSAVAIAMAADLTRDQHRTKSMAIIGSSIGVAFVLSLVSGPWLSNHIGVRGIFALTGALALAAMLIVLGLPSPQPSAAVRRDSPIGLGELLRSGDLMRLNVGIFVLHASLMSLFIGVPAALVASGVAASAHWKVYGAVMAGAVLLALPAVLLGERKGRGKAVFLGSVALLLSSQLLLLAARDSMGAIAFALLVYFAGFMLLEAALPAHVSRAAPADARGSAIAVYSTLQFIGAFVGAVLGGTVLQHLGEAGLLLMNVALIALWFAVAWGMRPPAVVGTRRYPVPALDAVRARGLQERLAALQGVVSARVRPGDHVVQLEVDVVRFDEQSVSKLIAGES